MKKTGSTVKKTALVIKKLNLRTEHLRVLSPTDLRLVAGGTCDSCEPPGEGGPPTSC